MVFFHLVYSTPFLCRIGYCVPLVPTFCIANTSLYIKMYGEKANGLGRRRVGINRWKLEETVCFFFFTYCPFFDGAILFCMCELQIFRVSRCMAKQLWLVIFAYSALVQNARFSADNNFKFRKFASSGAVLTVSSWSREKCQGC